VKGKWAKGIAPRFFSWIIKDKLAVSERPGGYARNHRRVRRQEEILWLRGEGFTRVVSLLTSPHNLHAYDELDMAWAHIPFGPHDDPHLVLPDLYAQLREWMASGERLLVHQEELSDRLMGVVSGYLRWSGLVPEGPQAISVVERIMHRQMGPDGRELVAMAPQLVGAGGCGGTITTRARTSEQMLARAKQSAATAAAALAAAVILDIEEAAEVDARPEPAVLAQPEAVAEQDAAAQPEADTAAAPPEAVPEPYTEPEPEPEPEAVAEADTVAAPEVVPEADADAVQPEAAADLEAVPEPNVVTDEILAYEAPPSIPEDEHHSFELQGVPDVPSEAIAGGSSNGAGERDTV
jgi:hypothetical protein